MGSGFNVRFYYSKHYLGTEFPVTHRADGLYASSTAVRAIERSFSEKKTQQK